MESLFKYKCIEVGYAELGFQNYAVFQKYLFLKSSEKVAVRKNCLPRKSAYFE